MKNILTIALILSVIVVAAQNVRVTNGGSGSEALLNAGNADLSSYGVAATFYNPKRKAEGSVHLFNNWDNYAVIFTNDNQKFSLKNINLNIERNSFESKISESSIFTFSLNNIEKFVINNKIFKTYYNDGVNRIFEIIYESEKLSIIKGYRIQLIEGSVNPQVNRKNDRYVQKYSYYLKRAENIKTFKLSKKKVLSLIKDQGKLTKMEKFVSTNKLSYKKEKDINKMFIYYDSL